MPLHLAAEYNSIECLEQLLSHEAEVNAEDKVSCSNKKPRCIVNDIIIILITT